MRMINWYKVGEVVQFNENHKWCGCLGIIEEIEQKRSGTRYLIGVPIPNRGAAYIFVNESEKAFEYIGKALLMPQEGDLDVQDSENQNT